MNGCRRGRCCCNSPTIVRRCCVDWEIDKWLVSPPFVLLHQLTLYEVSVSSLWFSSLGLWYIRLAALSLWHCTHSLINTGFEVIKLYCEKVIAKGPPLLSVVLTVYHVVVLCAQTYRVQSWLKSLMQNETCEKCCLWFLFCEVPRSGRNKSEREKERRTDRG